MHFTIDTGAQVSFQNAAAVEKAGAVAISSNAASSGVIHCDGILGSDISQFGTIRIDATNGLFAVGV